MLAVTFCSVPLYKFLENLLANRCKVQNVLHYFVKPGIFKFTSSNICALHHVGSGSSCKFWTWWTDLLTFLLIYTHNLIWKPQLCVLRHWLFQDKTGLKWPVWFSLYRAFGPIAPRHCFGDNTHTIKTVLKWPMWFGSYGAFGPIAPRHRSWDNTHTMETSFHCLRHWSFQHQIWRPHSVPTSLVVSGLIVWGGGKGAACQRLKGKQSEIGDVWHYSTNTNFQYVYLIPTNFSQNLL